VAGGKRASATTESGSRKRIDVALRGRHLIVFDAVATVASFVLSLALRFDYPSTLFDQFLAAYFWAIPLLLVARLGMFLGFRLYQRVWRYASVDELIAVLAAALGSSLVGYTVLYAVVVLTPFGALGGFPRSVPIIDTTLVVAFAGAWRFALRMTGVGRAGVGLGGSSAALVVGTAAAALQVLRELRSNPSLGFRPVGVLSDEIPRGQRLLGFPVVGGTSELAARIRETGVRAVLLALPQAEGPVLRKLVRQAEAEGAQCLTVPSIAEVVAGRVSVNALREIELEDLLRRAPARIDLDSVAGSFKDRTVLITGAGGSIGSELARQIVRFQPRRLVLLGRGENSIFEAMHSIVSAEEGTIVSPLILDIRDRTRLLRVFATMQPEIVFHAAAHKHVTFMEQFPEEAIATNVVGTANVLDAAARNGVDRFVFISTDKAVNPSSVMGATKRLGELLVRQVAQESRVRYVTVRFGNVLSSRGSVVPLFRQQLARGEPLTVTHPDAMRFFMTIPEAVQLVLQAAALAEPGDTFVLDMGEPVRIVQLARDLIQLHGLEPDVDIPVEFIGTRPGEKLAEELYFASERAEPTTHEAIRRVRLNGDNSDLSDLRAAVARLATIAETGDRSAIVGALSALIPGYALGTNAPEPTAPQEQGVGS
jgi:FlaA1/EpsC-like NDP-sugar epimerase